MRRACLTLLLLVLPASAQAESWHVLHAEVRAGDELVGQLYGVPVRPLAWVDATRARVVYADRVLDMQAELSLEDERTYVSIGVGRTSRVRQASGFRIDMRPLSWAPLLGRAQRGVRVALPEGLPAPEGVLVGAADVPGGADPPTDAFVHAGPPDRFEPACGALTLRAHPSRGAAPWRVPEQGAWLALGVERGGFTRARVFVEGFVVHGWLAGARPRCEGTIQMGGVGSACGDGHGSGVVVSLPAGTALYASRTARQPFAHLRAETVGVEPLDHAPAEACRSGVCRRVPAEPTGPARWIVHGHADAGGWLLTAWVRAPAESLARPPDGSSAFGGCWSPPSEWPRP